MGSPDDPGDYERRYLRQKQRISTLRDLDRDADAEAIRAWANTLTQAVSTRANLLKNVRTFAERAARTDRPPVTEMTSGEFWELHDALEAGDPDIAAVDPHFPTAGLKPGTLRNVRQALKFFFHDGLERTWAADLHIGKPEQTHVTEDDVFSREETQAIFDACLDTQEQALVAVFLATGLRIGAVHSLRLGDVDFRPIGTTTLGFVTIRAEVIGTKGLAGERPLTWATPYLSNWVGAHPHQGEADAALFCAKQSGTNSHGAFTRGDHVERRTLYRWLTAIGERAGVEKSMNPHTFRHTAITRMYQDSVPEKRIKWMVGWGKDSSQFERYVHLRDEEMMAGYLDDYGYEADTPDAGPALEECPQCHAPLHDWANPQACPGCGLPLGVVAADHVETAEDIQAAAVAAAFDANLPSEVREGLEAMHGATSDPNDFVEALTAFVASRAPSK